MNKMQMADPATLSRAIGCMLGGAAGDALGGLGQITSATQMSLFTAEGLLRGQVRFQTKGIGPIYSLMVGHSYLRWLQTQFPEEVVDVHKDGWLYSVPGVHTNRTPDRVSLRAITSLREFGDNHQMNIALAQDQSRGCGGVMRVAPVGLMASNTHSIERMEVAEWLFKLGCEIAQITHGHPEDHLSAGCFALIIAFLRQGCDLPEAVKISIETLRRQPGSATTVSLLRKALRIHAERSFDRESIETRLGGGSSGHEALSLAILIALSAASFDEGIQMAVNQSGDAYCIGSITGNLLGGFMGHTAISFPYWVEGSELRDAIEQVAKDLVSYPWWDFEQEEVWARYPGY